MFLSYLIPLVFFFFFFFVSAIVDARIELPSNVTVPAVFGFGDSIIDPGNNNYIVTLVRCNFPPYGKDFMGGLPTGRFSNGKIPTDILVEELGLKNYLPAYLDPELTPEELLTGVSFASGAAGYDPLTSTLTSVISLSQQLEMLKEYIGKITAIVGAERASFIVSNGLFVVVAGSDDIANTYFGVPLVRRAHYDFDAYSNLMLNHASSFIQELYGLGARRIGVFSTPPIGCVPSQRTLGSFPTRNCASDHNKVAQMFNSKLSSHIKSLKPTFPHSKIVYIDIYTPLLDIITYPAKYGFEVVTNGCCGTGLIEVTLLCNKLDPVCLDDSKYLFWDSYHPTQRGYQILTANVITNYVQQLL
ncbi:hypothetical protein V2J09_023924 [Rumex salicifolius]